jgi:3-hydroxyisobutyrate dehydrogenase
MTHGERIGFVGIGNMGAPMVRCLLRAGHHVTISDAAPAATEPFKSEPSVAVAPSLGDLAAECAVIITMLPDSAVVRRVVLGEPSAPGLSAGLRPGSLVIDMSSSYAPDTVRLGAAVERLGVRLIDAPVSGGVGKAVTGTLAIMVGGRVDDIDRAAPILAAMGTLHRTGALGSGHAMKALNNYVSAAGLVATCEALRIGASFGLDPLAMVRVLNASTGRNNTTENKAERYLVPRRFDSGFSLSLMAKDVGMARALAADLGIDADELAFVARYLDAASDALGPDADHTAVMAYVEGQR